MRDADADPLDLRPDSIAGVTGLVQAAQEWKSIAGQCAWVAAFLETPVLHAFLPGICRLLLSEDLLLPSVPTWWCGDQGDRDFIERNFSELVIRPAFGERPDQSLPDPLGHNSKPLPEIDDPRRWLSGPHTVAALSRWERQGLHAAMTNSPELFIANDPCSSPRPLCGMAKNCSLGKSRCERLPSPGAATISCCPADCRGPRRAATCSPNRSQRGSSKDVWVQADRPVERISLLSSPIIGLELRRTANDLPSRVADHLFWLGRMMERTEALVRHLRCILVRLTSELQPSGADAVALLVAALSPPGQSRLSAVVNTSAADSGLSESDIWDVIRAEMRSLSHRRGPPRVARANPALDTIGCGGDPGPHLGGRLANHQPVGIPRRTSEGDELGQSIVPLNRLLQGISAFSGLCSDSMTRGPGWRFLDLGRRIERGLQILHLIGGILVDTRTDILPRLEATLEIADSSMTYRYRYLTSLQLAAVLDLILADETNPRAVAFQLTAIAEHLRQLSVGRAAETLGAEQDRVLRAQGLLRLTDVDAISEEDQAGDRDRLQALVVHLSAELRSISEDVTHTYLTHTALPQRLTGQSPARGGFDVKYSVSHQTTYAYAAPVVLSQNQACVSRLRTCAGQVCEAFSLEISPEPRIRRPWTDYFGNRIWYFSFDQPHRDLSVTARSTIQRFDVPEAQTRRKRRHGKTCVIDCSGRRTLDTRRAYQYVPESPLIGLLQEAADYARPSFCSRRPLLSGALELMERIHADFEYQQGRTALDTPTAELLRQRRGVCQDFAHLAICCLRSIGLAARYVSGYLLTDPPAGQPKLIGGDASHAWLSVYCPGYGWLDLDPTNNAIPGVRHVITAHGRDYSDVTPVRGMIIGGGYHTMTVTVDVSPTNG